MQLLSHPSSTLQCVFQGEGRGPQLIEHLAPIMLCPTAIVSGIRARCCSPQGTLWARRLRQMRPLSPGHSPVPAAPSRTGHGQLAHPGSRWLRSPEPLVVPKSGHRGARLHAERWEGSCLLPHSRLLISRLSSSPSSFQALMGFVHVATAQHSPALQPLNGRYGPGSSLPVRTDYLLKAFIAAF